MCGEPSGGAGAGRLSGVLRVGCLLACDCCQGRPGGILAGPNCLPACLRQPPPSSLMHSPLPHIPPPLSQGACLLPGRAEPPPRLHRQVSHSSSSSSSSRWRCSLLLQSPGNGPALQCKHARPARSLPSKHPAPKHMMRDCPRIHTLFLPPAPCTSFINNLIDWQRVEQRYVAATSQ